MQPPSDAQLLRDYAERGTEDSFAKIVARYTDLVYSAALRQVYSPDLARDVTQSVFTDLARKARTVSANLSPEASLVGWLYRGTQFAARDLNRGEFRRAQRERQAMEQLHPAPESSSDWEQLHPVLDDVMSELDETDRDAVLLRYFKNQDLRTVGTILGISDDAAQKRVSRAVDRLRELFAKRGVTIGASGLAVVISANAVQAAPGGLALAISTAATLTGTTFATTATVTATKAIAMTALQKSIVTATIAVLAAAGIFEARQASQLRDKVQTLQQQHAPLVEQIQQLQTERERSARQLAALNADNERLNRSMGELLKLRGEVAGLRRDSQELALLKAGRAQPTDASGSAEMNAVLARVGELKQMLTQKPDLNIPELQFLTSQDWLNVAAMAKLETDSGTRIALSRLRSAGKMVFAPMLVKALTDYVQASSGQLPTTMSQLKPYFSPPVEDALLNRYELLATGKASDLPAPEPSSFEESPGNPGKIRVRLRPGRPKDSVISEHAKVDGEFDSVLSVGLRGSHLSEEGPIGSALDAVTRTTISQRDTTRTHD